MVGQLSLPSLPVRRIYSHDAQIQQSELDLFVCLIYCAAFLPSIAR